MRKSGEGRGHTRMAPRTLDLDLILYGDEIIEEDGLTVPHPRFREREFVLRAAGGDRARDDRSGHAANDFGTLEQESQES